MIPIAALIAETITLNSPTSLKLKREEELRLLRQQSAYCYILDPELRTREDKAKTLTLDNNLLAQLQFGTRISDIHKLESDWDGYQATAPSEDILKKASRFIEILPNNFREKLETDYIFPNPNGTISIEWRNGRNVVSVEIGEKMANFYSIIGDKKDSEDHIIDLSSGLPSKLIDSLNDFFASY